MPLLDLTEREDASFDPLPAGKYLATVHEAEERQSKGTGKIPVVCPMIAIQWKLDEPLFEYPQIGTEDDAGIKIPNWENRRVFSQTVVPPKEIDGEPYKNYKMMNGIVFRLLEALGYSEKELNSGSYEPDYEDMKERQAIITVGRYTYTDEETDEKTIKNDVKGFKPVTAEQAEAAGVI